jgi:hypothetical protein
VDSRAEQLDQLRLADITAGPADVTVHRAVHRRVGAGAAAVGAHVLIMTHDHAEDFRALRLRPAAGRPAEVGECRLIGSSAKWTRFQHNLKAAGHEPEAIREITSPIGLPGIAGKDPAVIAVGVAAALIPLMREPARPEPDEARAPRLPATAQLDIHITVQLMTLYRASVLDTPGDPFADGPAALASESDAAIVVRDGVITARGGYAEVGPSTRTRRSSTCGVACSCPA